jgi:hypothetical protein
VDPIRPSSALFIKLGRGGTWERDCIQEGVLRIGYRDVDHEVYERGDWDQVVEKFTALRGDRGTARRDAAQIRYFYEAGPNVLWMTFVGDRLWWCFSEPVVEPQDDRSKIRRAVGGWRDTDIKGVPLAMDRLSGRLLSVQGFRGTICNVKEFEYLVRKINAATSPEIAAAESALADLETRLEDILHHLHWKDFEILIDLIFREAGWRRAARVGGSTKTLDVDLYSPITDERFGVQVKAKASLDDFEAYQDRFTDLQGYARLFFVVHSPGADLTDEARIEGVDLWLPRDVARFTVKYGLAEWVLEKAS